MGTNRPSRRRATRKHHDRAAFRARPDQARCLPRGRHRPPVPHLSRRLRRGEDDFQVFCRRYGLPTPPVNTEVHGFEVDAYFASERLIIELDGWAYHGDKEAFESDRVRDATMLLHGIPTVRVTYDRLEHHPDREAGRLQAILASRRGT